jgi:hypothetical protein
MKRNYKNKHMAPFILIIGVAVMIVICSIL